MCIHVNKGDLLPLTIFRIGDYLSGFVILISLMSNKIVETFWFEVSLEVIIFLKIKKKFIPERYVRS